MTMSFVGTATEDTHCLPVSDHRSENFLTLRSPMTSLDPNEIKRVKLYSVNCSKYKLAAVVQLDEIVCPVCGTGLPAQERSM